MTFLVFVAQQAKLSQKPSQLVVRSKSFSQVSHATMSQRVYTLANQRLHCHLQNMYEFLRFPT